MICTPTELPMLGAGRRASDFGNAASVGRPLFLGVVLPSGGRELTRRPGVHVDALHVGLPIRKTRGRPSRNGQLGLRVLAVRNATRDHGGHNGKEGAARRARNDVHT